MTESGINSPRRSDIILALSGLWIVLFCAGLIFISTGIAHAESGTEKHVLRLVALLATAGALFVLTTRCMRSVILGRKQLLWIIGIGFAARIILIPSQPILEDDYFRYLWDGAVTANTLKPYEYAPLEVSEGRGLPSVIRTLNEDGNNITENINHPHLRSIYPPVAQGFFAISYMVEPFSLPVWKILILAADIVTLFLLIRILGMLGLPSSNLAIYWWNPLLLKEIYNSGHLDPLLFPFLLGALILALAGRQILSVAGIIIAAGIKLWPAFLLPVIIRPLLSRPKELIAALFTATAGLTLIFLPLYLSGLNQGSGLIAYGTSWQNNDSAFRLLIFISEHALEWLGYKPFAKYKVARAAALGLTLLWITYITFRRKNENVVYKALVIAAFIFLISPTQFPWYYTWLLPLLVFYPRLSLLSLTVLLPLYYLRYYFEPRGQLDLFTDLVVWIEFIPVWILILAEWHHGRGERESLTV